MICKGLHDDFCGIVDLCKKDWTQIFKSSQCSTFIPFGNIKKPSVFCCYQRAQKCVIYVVVILFFFASLMNFLGYLQEVNEYSCLRIHI